METCPVYRSGVSFYNRITVWSSLVSALAFLRVFQQGKSFPLMALFVPWIWVKILIRVAGLVVTAKLHFIYTNIPLIFWLVGSLTFHVRHVTLSFSQIYLSWKSGPAEVKHWKDMMGRPRTAVSQWHALKAWGTQRPPCLQCSYLQNSTICSLALQIMCVISLFSGLFDILCPQSLWHHFKILPLSSSDSHVAPSHPFVWT